MYWNNNDIVLVCWGWGIITLLIKCQSCTSLTCRKPCLPRPFHTRVVGHILSRGWPSQYEHLSSSPVVFIVHSKCTTLHAFPRGSGCFPRAMFKWIWLAPVFEHEWPFSDPLRLPEGFTQLLNLTELYLNDTFLDYLPGSFGRWEMCIYYFCHLLDADLMVSPLSLDLDGFFLVAVTPSNHQQSKNISFLLVQMMYLWIL